MQACCTLLFKILILEEFAAIIPEAPVPYVLQFFAIILSLFLEKIPAHFDLITIRP